jgi:hypothetical protein
MPEIPDEVIASIALELLLTDEKAAPRFAAARYPVRDEAEAASLLEEHAIPCAVCGVWMYPESLDLEGRCEQCAEQGEMGL